MKVFTYISLILALTCSACQNRIEELPYDIFDDFNAQLFTVTEYFAHPVSNVTTTIFFETNFDLADYPDIKKYIVYYDTPDGPDMKSIYNVDRTNYFYIHFFAPDFPYCFEFEVVYDDDSTSRRDITFCPDW